MSWFSIVILWDTTGSPTTSQQQNTDDRDSPALELHAITAVDWLERRMQCTHKTTTDIASSYTEQLFADGTLYKKAATSHSMHKRLWMTRNTGRLHGKVRTPVFLCVSTRLIFKTSCVNFGINQCTINCLTLVNSALVIWMLRFTERTHQVWLCTYAGLYLGWTTPIHNMFCIVTQIAPRPE